MPDPLLGELESAWEGESLEAQYAAAERAAEFYEAEVRRQGNYVFFEFSGRESKRFVARLECSGYPAEPPDLEFLDPRTRRISGSERDWPPNSPLLTDSDGLHLCLPGTRWFETTHGHCGTIEDRGLARILGVLAVCCNGQSQALALRRRRRR